MDMVVLGQFPQLSALRLNGVAATVTLLATLGSSCPKARLRPPVDWNVHVTAAYAVETDAKNSAIATGHIGMPNLLITAMPPLHSARRNFP
jgi:hypothetical protein